MNWLKITLKTPLLMYPSFISMPMGCSLFKILSSNWMERNLSRCSRRKTMLRTCGLDHSAQVWVRIATSTSRIMMKTQIVQTVTSLEIAEIWPTTKRHNVMLTSIRCRKDQLFWIMKAQWCQTIWEKNISCQVPNQFQAHSLVKWATAIWTTSNTTLKTSLIIKTYWNTNNNRASNFRSNWWITLLGRPPTILFKITYYHDN